MHNPEQNTLRVFYYLGNKKQRMGSGFGMDGSRSVGNNRNQRKKRVPFAGRGDAPDHRIMQFNPKTKLSAKQLKKLGLAQRHSENQRRLKALVVTLVLGIVLSGVIYFLTQ